MTEPFSTNIWTIDMIHIIIFINNGNIQMFDKNITNGLNISRFNSKICWKHKEGARTNRTDTMESKLSETMNTEKMRQLRQRGKVELGTGSHIYRYSGTGDKF